MLDDYKDYAVVRTRDPKLLDTLEIVVDVGGVYDPKTDRYDHHQRSFNESMSTVVPGAKWVTKLSASGLVYAHFGRRVIQAVSAIADGDPILDVLYNKIYAEFMEEYDGDSAFAPEPGLRLA